MPQFPITVENGTQTFKNSKSRDIYHDIAFEPIGVAGGTFVLRGRKRGSAVFEDITSTDENLTSPNSIQITGTVEEYQITMRNVTSDGQLIMTDNSWGGRE